MRATRVLAIIAILGIAFSFRASAKVAYDKETTNEWFRVIAADSGEFPKPRWTKPTDGEVSVVDSKIALDTDLDDPLIYTPTTESGPVAIVTAEYTATANAAIPDLTDTPQAALAVIANGAETNWYGLVKEDASAGWEKFTNVIPTVGETYTIHIDLNNETHQIRYWVGDTILGTGWYDNPKSAETKVTSVSFAGTGNIGDFGGDNVEDALFARIDNVSEGAGYDFTNGTVSVRTYVKAGKTGMATLKVIDFVTGDVVDCAVKSVSGSSAVSTWDLSDKIAANLLPGGTYGYTVEVEVDGEVAATASGTFTAANWDGNVWFGADPTANPKTVRGTWEAEPEIVDSQYALKGDSTFNLDKNVPEMGTNRVSRVDAKVTYDALSDGDLEVVEDMFSGFTAVAEENGDTKWMALSSENDAAAWVELTGAIAPAAGKPYVIRAELDFLSSTARVRYLVSEDDGATFVSLASATGTWLPLALPKTQLDGIVLKGNSSLAKLEAKVSDKALAEVGGVKYEDTTAAMNAALAAGASVELLTYATLKPTAPGAYTISANGFGYKVEVPNGDWTYSKDGNTLTVIRKETPSNKDVAASAITYGQALTESVLSGTVTNEAGTAVAGTLAWVDEDQIYPNVQDAATNRLYEVAFTPENPDLYKSATLKIPVPVNRAELTVFVKDEVIAQGDALPTFSYTNITGFVRGESEASVVGGTATFTTTYTTDSPVGTYPIAYASGLTADNYSFVSSNGTLTVVAAATIDAVTEGEGFDFTNGTVSATVSVSSAKGGTVALKVVDFATGNVIGTYGTQDVNQGTGTVSWDLSDAIADGLVPGGTYSYEIEVTVDGKAADAEGGTFTAANWDDDLWFGADPTTDPDTVNGGSWNKTPTIDDHCYTIEDSSIFSLTDETSNKGTNRVSHVDAKVTFETLVDGDADVPDNEPIGAFVATTDGWKALANDGNGITWIGLTGALAPQAGVAYTVRAELDFLSATKRVRYLVSTDGENFVALATEDGEWIDLTADKTTLASVELSGAGKLAKLEATVADKAIAEVNGVKYDTMDAALEAAGTEGTNTIKILTNATINPTEPGSYDIAPNNYHYVSGGKVSTDTTNTKTIVIDPSGNPVVRPSTATMKLVETPEGAQYKDVNSLRAFLERNGVEAYQNEDAEASDITTALNNESGSNNLKLWQDYALGVDKDTPVAPVTIPTGDKDKEHITLAIPAVVAATPSDDYVIKYQVTDGATSVDQEGPDKILIPLEHGTGTYTIKAVFDPAK